MESLTQDADGVRVVLLAANGKQTVEARYLVGCDGASSPTRHFLGLAFEGSTHPRLFYVADVEMEFQVDEGTFYGALGHDSFVLMFPMQGEKHWRLVGNLPEYNNQVNQDVTYDEVENKVKALVQRPLDITNVRWFSTYKVHTPDRGYILYWQMLSSWRCRTYPYTCGWTGNEHGYPRCL